MEVFKNARSVRLKSHLGTYLCAVDDEGGGGAVSHGYRRNSRGTVWGVELAGDDCIRLQGQRGLYLGATELPAALDGAGRGTRACCWVIQGVPSTPNDNAFLWSPLREGEHLTLSGPYGRRLRARFGQTPQDRVVTVNFGTDPEESSWVVEVVPPEAVLPLVRPPPSRAQSCDARMERGTTSGRASSVFSRFYSVKESKGELEEPSIEEPNSKTGPRLIYYNTARDDGSVDDIDDGTWKSFPFNEQSLVALHHRLEQETQHEDFVICRRSYAVPRLFPVVLDLPPGNKDMEFVLVLVSSGAAKFLFQNGTWSGVMQETRDNFSAPECILGASIL